MKNIFLILISIFLLTHIILTKKENNDINNDIDSDININNDTKKINNESKEIIYDEDKGYFSPDKIHELNDLSFDYYIRKGKIYRWFIFFYSRSCGHCKRAKKEIQKIFDTYKNTSTLRFAQIEAYQNTMTNVRFNISGVPYMILVQNNTIYEMDLFPNYDNLKNFVFSNFDDIKEDIKPLPKKVKFIYVAWLILKQTLGDITTGFNQYLKNKGINFQFNTIGFVGSIISIIILICWGCIRFCLYCCCNDEEFALELQRLEEEFNKKKNDLENKEQKGQNIEEEEEEYEYEEEEEDDEVEQVEGDKKMTEEEKRKKIEEEKEKEVKEVKEIKEEEKPEEEQEEKEKKEKEINEDKKEKKE